MHGLLLLAAAFSLTAAAPPEPKPFTLTSTSFVDGQAMPTRYAGNLLANPNCVGTNQTPALGWRNLPAGTKSLVFSFRMPTPVRENRASDVDLGLSGPQCSR